MELSKRLQTVADLVDGKSIIDVGCDHGYLDIYLTKKDINCLATDISKYCIDKAIDNFNKENLSISTKVTNGLDDIDIKLYDTIILSGMGTHTILKILQDKQLTDTIIVSSNNDLELLRKKIVKIGYFIDNEKYINENNKDYVIIRFKKGQKKYNDLDYVLGPILKHNNDYLHSYITECQNILDKIPNNHEQKRKYYLYIIEECNQLLKNNDNPLYKK